MRSVLQACCAIILCTSFCAYGVDAKPRAREIGIPFDGTPGQLNAITDVAPVTVGYTTLVAGSGDQSGVADGHRCDIGDRVELAGCAVEGNANLAGARLRIDAVRTKRRAQNDRTAGLQYRSHGESRFSSVEC